MRRFQIILFDLDGTLLDFEEAERRALGLAMAEFRLPCSENTQSLYHAINQHLWEQYEVGRVTKEELKVQRFRELFRALDIPMNAARMNTVYQNMLAQCAAVKREAREVCAHLARQSRLYIVTNGTAEVQRSRFALSGLEGYFRDIFISDELGAHKPEPEFFGKVFEKLRCGETEKAEILMVGDTISADVKGALRAGLCACWYNPSGRKNYSSFMPHYEIRSLTELIGIVESDGR